MSRAAGAFMLLLGPAAISAQALTPSGWYLCNSMDRYNTRMNNVNTNCCTGFGQTDNNCADTGVPLICDTRCALSFVPFYEECSDFITSADVGREVESAFLSVYGMCQAVQRDNVVHDTDPVTPGDQFDPDARLVASVSCHQTPLGTAQELTDSTGPMDGLWMFGTAGDRTCQYTDSTNCEVIQNRKILWDAMDAEFGACNLVDGNTGDGHRRTQYVDNPTLICDWTLDTNGDGQMDSSDDIWSGGSFAAIVSKDALYFMVTNEVTAPLVSYAECDEVVGGR